MRATSAAFVLIVALVPRAPDNYADILAEYHSGDQTAALERLARLTPQAVDDGFELLLTRLSAALGQTAAAMHTEAAFRPLTLTSPRSSAHHLDLATQLIEKGQAVKGRLARPLPKSPLWPVTGEFRRLWYVSVITALEATGQLGPATKYSDQARELYPKDADVLLLSAIGEEMRASARTEGLADGDRRESLEHAERYLRDAVAANPDRLEAQLRLGRVLYLRHDPAARDVLLRVTESPDARLRYLSALFLGAAWDAAHDGDAARTWYTKAVATLPNGQAAVLALSEYRYRTGDLKGAVAVLPAAVGDRSAADPWWTYVFGEHWRTPILLDALRKARQR